VALLRVEAVGVSEIPRKLRILTGETLSVLFRSVDALQQ